jgi:hypothetical protein
MSLRDVSIRQVASPPSSPTAWERKGAGGEGEGSPHPGPSPALRERGELVRERGSVARRRNPSAPLIPPSSPVAWEKYTNELALCLDSSGSISPFLSHSVGEEGGWGGR